MMKKVEKNIESCMISLCGEIDVLFLLDNGDHHIPEVLAFWSSTIVKGTFPSVIQRNTARGFNCSSFSTLRNTTHSSSRFQWYGHNGTIVLRRPLSYLHPRSQSLFGDLATLVEDMINWGDTQGGNAESPT